MTRENGFDHGLGFGCGLVIALALVTVLGLGILGGGCIVCMGAEGRMQEIKATEAWYESQIEQPVVLPGTGTTPLPMELP